MKTEIYLASDHAAFEAKEALKAWLKNSNDLVVHDLGTDSTESTSYADYGFKLAQKIKTSAPESRGIALCGSGIGISMALNRFKQVRAALCRDQEDAKMARLHNDANVLCLGARRTSIEDMKKIIETFLTTAFEGGRHQARVSSLSTQGC